jgi:hypothetical protein
MATATLVLALAVQACADNPSSKDGGVARDAGADGTSPATSPLGLFCSPGVNPTDPLIADFAAGTFNNNKGRWGGPLNLTLYVYEYHAPNTNNTGTYSVDNDQFNFSGQVVPSENNTYAGGGIHFDSCLDTPTYKGIQFTLTGYAGGCTVYFEMQTYSAEPINERGGCASYCFHYPRIAVTPRSTPITVYFSDVAGTGVPGSAAGIASEVMGLRWQVELPSGVDAGAATCTFSLAVDDVKLVK